MNTDKENKVPVASKPMWDHTLSKLCGDWNSELNLFKPNMVNILAGVEDEIARNYLYGDICAKCGLIVNDLREAVIQILSSEHKSSICIFEDTFADLDLEAENAVKTENPVNTDKENKVLSLQRHCEITPFQNSMGSEIQN